MRTVLIGLIVVLLMFSCVWALRSNQNVAITSGKLEDERYKRMVVEEDLQKANSQLNDLSAELVRAQDKITKLEVTVQKADLIITDFKKRLDDAAVIKGNLDKQISDLKQLVTPM